jgi:multiple sugar transport system permease protein
MNEEPRRIATGRLAARRKPASILASAALALAFLFVVFPIAWLAQMSLRPNEDILGYRLLFKPTLDHYSSLVEGKFLHYFLNSVLSSSLSTAIALLVGTPAAYVLSRWRFRGHRHVALWVLSTRMAPQIAFTIPFFLFFRRVGLNDTVWGLALIYLTFNLALVIWMMRRSSTRCQGRSRKPPGWTAAASGRPFCASPCRSPLRDSRRLRCFASSFRGTTSSTR